jgi:hypothetical protein
MRSKKGPLVHISFLDHAMDTSDKAAPIECDVFGVLYKEDKKAYYVASWVCGKDPFDHNSETFVVVKMPGVKIKRLK